MSLKNLKMKLMFEKTTTPVLDIAKSIFSSIPASPTFQSEFTSKERSRSRFEFKRPFQVSFGAKNSARSLFAVMASVNFVAPATESESEPFAR